MTESNPHSAVILCHHYAKEYVDLICGFLSRSQQCAWNKFRRVGVEATAAQLDIPRSLALQREYNLPERMCFLNAARMALTFEDELDYVEGIATCIAPTYHAWLLDRASNRIIDPTWIIIHTRTRRPEQKIKDYFGVVIPMSVIIRSVLRGEVNWRQLDDYLRAG
jgi:hypothetical protein